MIVGRIARPSLETLFHPTVVWVGSQSPKSPVSITYAPGWVEGTVQEEKECILQDMNRVYAFCAFAFSCFIAQLSFVLKKMPSQTCALWISVTFPCFVAANGPHKPWVLGLFCSLLYLYLQGSSSRRSSWLRASELVLGAGADPQCFLIYLIRCGPLSPAALKAKAFFHQSNSCRGVAVQGDRRRKNAAVCTQLRGEPESVG